MRLRALLCIGAAAVTLTAGNAASYPKVTRKHEGLREYSRALINRNAAIRAGVSTAWGEAMNRPHEWGRGVSGVSKRFGSSLAHHAVNTTIRYGVGGLLHEDQSRYVYADRPGFKPKVEAAFENTFFVYHKHSDKRYVAAGRLSGDFGSGLISRLWQPARFHTFASGMTTGGISLGADFGFNLARQYMHHNRARARRSS